VVGLRSAADCERSFAEVRSKINDQVVMRQRAEEQAAAILVCKMEAGVENRSFFTLQIVCTNWRLNHLPTQAPAHQSSLFA